MSSSAGCVFVCGATGTIGSMVLQQLHALYPDVPVKAQCRDESKAKAIHAAHPQAELAKLDFNDIQVEPLRGATSLFLLSPYSVDMLVQVRQLVDAAKEAGVKHIVHLGVHQPSQRTMVSYVAWHRLCETYIEASGLSYTHLRPNMFYENLVNYAGMKSVQGDKLYFPMKPETKVAWVAAEDIALVSAKSLVDVQQHHNKIYPISSAVCTFQEVVAALKEAVPKFKNLELVVVPVEGAIKQLVETYKQDPSYMITGFKRTVEEMNAMGDCSGIPGAKEGLDVVRSVGGREPLAPAAWAAKQKWE